MTRPRIFERSQKRDDYEEAILAYNQAHAEMEEIGTKLDRQRTRSAVLIEVVTELINSIAHQPKNFDSDIARATKAKADFINAQDFAMERLREARASAASAGAGITVGIAAASMAPNVAMWTATTFGTASTGTAISTLSGVAAENAALAWLGGGALSAGGGGMAAGNALLALAGPIGWSIAGASILASTALFSWKRMKHQKKKREELMRIERNTDQVQKAQVDINDLKTQTDSLCAAVTRTYRQCTPFHGTDFIDLDATAQHRLTALVNQTLSLGILLNRRI